MSRRGRPASSGTNATVGEFSVSNLRQPHPLLVGGGMWTPSSAELPSLATRAVEHLESLPVAASRAAGYWRTRDNYFLNITYPSLQILGTIAPETTAQAIKVGTAGRRVALYVHVPFCTAACFYCHYYKVFHPSQDTVEDTVSALAAELQMYRKLCGHLRYSAIYVGGGTPSYLSESQIARLFRAIDDVGDRDNTTEVSFEVHPESATEAKLQLLAELGVTRMSMGVESFSERMLQQENRRHTAAEAIDSYHRAKAAGLPQVNIDLIYGMRDQFVNEWSDTLTALAELMPDSATAYYMRLRRKIPELYTWTKDPSRFSSDEEMMVMHAMTVLRLEEDLDYREHPVDWFIRPGTPMHSYQDYNWRLSDSTPLIGVGPSAYSYVGGVQYYNINDVDRYLETIGRSEFPIWRGEQLSVDDRIRRMLVLGLKVGIDLAYAQEAFDADVLELFRRDWDKLQELSLVAVENGWLRLTALGRLLADEVGRTFYSTDVQRRMASIDQFLISTTAPTLNRN
jgi:oxygen-independent coproporphyrinogen-3 oxidase